jgi:BirA family transcriptional regulator, biotin operon repressor / biotin---[acetyl-CoA-carboxylase] ligase
MDEHSLRKILADLPLGEMHFFEQVGSTNDVALAWATEAAPDWSLVVADEQTAGRGRGRRNWFTPPGAALAFSLVLRPQPSELNLIPLFSAVGALAVSCTLESIGFKPQIKWPNDILLRRRKVSGVLAESVWTGEQVDSVVLGIGLNIRPSAVPSTAELRYPATCLEIERSSESPQEFDREKLLHIILQKIVGVRPQLGSEDFLRAWQDRLAFVGEPVEVWGEDQPARAGKVLGLEPDGSLRLLSPSGESFSVHFGEIHLRPLP